MAKATWRIEKQQTSQVEQEAKALGEILGMIAKNKEAIMEFVEIVDELHKAGLLQIAQGILKNRQQIGLIGINQLNKSGAQRFIRNGMTAVEFLGKLDPDQLKQVLGAVSQGLAQAHPSERPMGMWGMLSTLRDPEVNASVSMVMNFLRGMGQGLPNVH